MRTFYYDEAPIDTLLQIAEKPIRDGDLVSKSDRDNFVRLAWVSRCEGWNIITPEGRGVIRALKLSRLTVTERAANMLSAARNTASILGCHHTECPKPVLCSGQCEDKTEKPAESIVEGAEQLRRLYTR